jgi:hypothetical protein
VSLAARAAPAAREVAGVRRIARAHKNIAKKPQPPHDIIKRK